MSKDTQTCMIEYWASSAELIAKVCYGNLKLCFTNSW